MNRNIKLRIAAAAVALGATAAPLMSGCGDNPLDTLCCKEFTPGADMASVDWGLEGSASANFSAFMQATGDLTALASAMASDVGAACQNIALDLDDTLQPNAVKETDPGKAASAWCGLAASAIGKIKGSATLTVNVQPPSCTVNASVQGSCEAKCTAKAECEITPAQIVARCDPGKLSGKCDAQCTGSCEGSANLAVTCEGECSGTCEGTCMGTCATQGAGGECAGSCQGTCSGKCRGSCKVAANAMVTCEADCTGGCSVDVKAPKCKAELTPPSAECTADANCEGGCKASASAKAECHEGSVEIVASANTQEIARLVATLRVNLPKLYLALQARGEAFKGNVEAVVNLSGSIDVTASAKATACLIPAAQAIGQAAANAGASVSASGSVVASVK